MASTVKRGYLEFPTEWTHVESRGPGPFTTRVAHEVEDGSILVLSSRRHRKGFGLEVVPPTNSRPTGRRPSLMLSAAHDLNWRIAVLFMIGSFGFILGSILVLAGLNNVLLINAIFFVGSIFFTSAGYLQYYQSINTPTVIGVDQPAHERKWIAWQPGSIAFWVTFSQFLGTLMFNVNTFDAFLNLGWIGQDLGIWVPDMIGSILFQISGTLAIFEICHRWFCWRDRSLAWWSTMINFIGCVAFLISACLAFVRPDPIFANLAFYATVFTLIGAICFFVGAYLILPEMSAETTVNT